jgi:hypothetical protein
MSDNRDNYWDDEDEDDSIEQFSTDTDLVKKLRKALKAEQKRNKELETNLGELTKSQKERILKDVLATRGLNPKIAQYVPSDIELNPDAINTWIDGNADVFGIKQSEKPPVSEQDLAAMQKMDSTITGAEASSGSDSMEMRLANATSEEEILSILSGN